MGKGRAVADWKCKLRAWNAWKAYVACVKSNHEAKAIEQKMKENYRFFVCLLFFFISSY